MDTVPVPHIAGDTAPLLWTVQEVYSAAECQSFIDLIEGSSPTLATNNRLYRDQDRVIRDDPACAMDCLSNETGVDYKDRIEVVYHLFSYTHRHGCVLKVNSVAKFTFPAGTAVAAGGRVVVFGGGTPSGS